MCGFCGFTGETENNKKTILDMTNKIIHRGPDDQKFFFDKDKITLGFCRLSFVDLNHGEQPIFNENKSIAIVFNGEIYNYLSLREQLIKKGHNFYTETDTEVIIHLYEQYGFDLFKYLRGMFAFVIYDKNKKIIFGARDFFGIKPFYYSLINNKDLIFGSEIKSFFEYPKFQKKINPLALENYLTFQYSVLPETFFQGIYKLMPGHYFIYICFP